ncbi:YncE family protein [Subtercola lobariae]|uniref:YncE family protein n=1 Tax=Subtercola lobariae TaxID=1588641 RepID=A0A917B7E2_9MICO|nr:YncE family protein [Subtercola lobariae]GGF29648.1 hypothetical protein GCM10011399_23490 [Subtercola lobariae]
MYTEQSRRGVTAKYKRMAVIGALLSVPAVIGGSSIAYASGPGDPPPMSVPCTGGVCAVGDAPSAIGVNPVTNRIYVSGDILDGTIRVIDGATSSVIGLPITVGSGPVSIAVNSVTDKIYVSNMYDGSVSVIDGVSDTVVKTIDLGSSWAGAVTVNEKTNTIYAAQANVGGQIVAIDGVTDTISGPPVPLSMVEPGNDLAVDPATNRLYVLEDDVPAGSPGVLEVIDLTSRARLALITVGQGPWGLAVDSAHQRAYVNNFVDGTMTVINTVSNSMVSSVKVGTQAKSVAVDSATNTIFSVVGSTNSVQVVDGKSLAIVANLPVGRDPYGIAANPQTHFAYVANLLDDSVSIIQRPTSAPTITASDILPMAALKRPYHFDLGATGFLPPVCRVVGSPPPGVNVSKTTCVVAGTPTRAGTFDFEVTATNPVGSATSDYEIVVSP